jgi:nucleoside-diphosphate-sugar epimerase
VLSVDKVAEHFFDKDIGTFNCPVWQDTKQINISSLDNQRTIYATTKLANESLIRKYCSNFKIVRIWDIV